MEATLRKPILALAGLLVGMSTTSALAEQSAPARETCFFARQFENWKAPDANTIYIRVGTNVYYRLDLSAPCPELLKPGFHLTMRMSGSDNICTASDWNLTVTDNLGGIRVPCMVKTMTRLSDAEAAAIPPKFKP